jgi:hypothetical protein
MQPKQKDIQDVSNQRTKIAQHIAPYLAKDNHVKQLDVLQNVPKVVDLFVNSWLENTASLITKMTSRNAYGNVQV